MKPAGRQDVYDFGRVRQRFGFGAYLLSMVRWPLGASGLLRRALMRALGFLSTGLVPTSDRQNRLLNTKPRLALTIDQGADSLNLVVTNRSRAEIWAEEAKVDLIDVETDGEIYSPAQAILRIRELITPAETLHISLIDTVYNAAGRPQGIYSCSLATVLRYRSDGTDEEFEQSFPSYRAKMIALVPISLRRMVTLDKSARSRGSENIPPLGGGEQSKRIRRSQRVTTQSAVVIEGRFSDGSPFLRTTHALVLSAHGCLVSLPQPIEIGAGVILRSPSTRSEQHCQVVYIGKTHAGEVQVGLGFETEAPDFWGVDCLPSIGKQ
jgi:hypothetical protein